MSLTDSLSVMGGQQPEASGEVASGAAPDLEQVRDGLKAIVENRRSEASLFGNRPQDEPCGQFTWHQPPRVSLFDLLMIVKARPVDNATDIAHEIRDNVMLNPTEHSETWRVIAAMQLARQDAAHRLNRILADDVQDQEARHRLSALRDELEIPEVMLPFK